MKLKKRNKQNLFISQGVSLPEKWFSKTAKYWKLSFRWRQRERRKAMTLKIFFSQTCVHLLHYQLNEFSKY